MPPPSGSFSALILSGGRARRLGGLDKANTLVGGRPLLDRVRAAVVGASEVVVVGHETAGGPVAAIAAGLGRLGAPTAGLGAGTAGDVVVLAADLPFITAAAVDQLRAALTTGVALAVDDAGKDQRLCAAWRAHALRHALAALADYDGASVRSLVAAAPAVVRVRLGGHPPPWFDCDTPADLAQARRWAESPR